MLKLGENSPEWYSLIMELIFCLFVPICVPEKVEGHYLVYYSQKTVPVLDKALLALASGHWSSVFVFALIQKSCLNLIVTKTRIEHMPACRTNKKS